MRATVQFAAVFVCSVAPFLAAMAAAQTTVPQPEATFAFEGQSLNVTAASPSASRPAGIFASLPPVCAASCIAPVTVAQGVATIAEPDVFAFLEAEVAQNVGLLVDARSPEGRARGFIPGSVSLPHATLAPDNDFRDEILTALGARAFEDVFNFTDAQNLVIFDDGPTQTDAGLLVAHLLDAGYPPAKLRYYRGGMQVWSVLGLTIQE